MSFLQALLLALFGWMGSIYSPVLIGGLGGWYTIGRPLVSGLIIGAILGDVKTGIIMLPLTADEDLIRRYVDLCDGFSIPGGQDPDPRLWGETDNTTAEKPCPERDALEVPLVRMVAEADKPLFATCRGLQIMNVALGGSLCTDVPNISVPEGTMHWRHDASLVDVVHPVEVMMDVDIDTTKSDYTGEE